jgi:hypothetical protein
MRCIGKKFRALFAGMASLTGLFSASWALAAPRCGDFQMLEMPGRVVNIVPFEDGTAAAIGSAASNPALPVLRYFDGLAWSEHALPSELDGFAFSAAGSTPEGKAWFAATRAYSVYEIEVAFVRVNAGTIERIDRVLSASGAPLDISASASNDVWALTAKGDVFRFDGSQWGMDDVPPVFIDQHLNPKGIYAVSPSDVWIAGYGSVGKNADMGFVQHWDGTQWEVVATPHDGQTTTHFFLDIDGSGSDDIWVSGYGLAGIGAVLMHWDGVSWSNHPELVSNVSMSRVMTMGPGDAWASPVQGNGMYYWNGNFWVLASEFAFPPQANVISVRDVEKAGACDAWVVGDYHDGTSYHPWAARLVPGDVQTEIFVSSTQISRVRASRKAYYGRASVTISNGASEPAAGVRVSGNFSGPTSEHQIATTGADGVAVFTTEVVNRPEGDWCFSVSNVEMSGAAYNPDLNTGTLACETTDGGSGGGGGKGGKRKR